MSNLKTIEISSSPSLKQKLVSNAHMCLLLLTMLGEFEEIPCKDTYQNSYTQTQVAKAKRTSWLLSANRRIAERSQMYRRESRVLCELIFVGIHQFRILMHDHLLILTDAYIHDDIVSTASSKQ